LRSIQPAIWARSCSLPCSPLATATTFCAIV